jgi:hypothetical protein
MFPAAMTELVAVAAIGLVAWFAAGTIWNVRRGSEAMRWLQGGLPVLGERTRVRWLGSSVVQLVIDEGKAELARATVVIFLEPRDLPWWPLSRLRGRRDTLIVRGVLRAVPPVEFEALDPASWSGKDARPRVPQEWETRKTTLDFHGETAAALGRAETLLARATAAGLTVRRLSVRRTEPNFQLHVALPDGLRPARELFQAVRALAGMALK